MLLHRTVGPALLFVFLATACEEPGGAGVVVTQAPDTTLASDSESSEGVTPDSAAPEDSESPAETQSPSDTQGPEETEVHTGCADNAACQAGPFAPCMTAICGVDHTCHATPVDDGTACEDGDPCTNGTCHAGSCQQAAIVGCGCGDGTCKGSEDCTTCTADCGPCAATCGDGQCTNETCATCPKDCGPCGPVCGDQKCEAGETCVGCVGDCGPCAPSCGDHACNGSEDCTSCAGDCGACPAGCGDHHCDANESCSSCPGDCGFCAPKCNDGECQAGETCSSCPGDCGACVNVGDCCYEQSGPGCADQAVRECTCAVSPICCNERWDSICAYTAAVFGCATTCTNFCGDGNCSESFEDGTSCPEDCKSRCGDAICQTDESEESCATDCGYPYGCCTATYEAGCNVPSIRDCVCAYDSYCCTSWDWACTQYVELQMCGDCGSNSCGDGYCDANENCSLCARDCGACTGECFLDSVACSTDDECCSGFCGGLTGCIGNEPCKSNGQSCDGNMDCCSAECGPSGTCIAPSCKSLGVPCSGNSECCSGVCDEFCQMGGTEVCGNHTCAGGETCGSCAADCGACGAVCGDHACNGGETCSSCEADCGACTGPKCGDHTCNNGETCTSCEGDCGKCATPECEGDWTLGSTFWVDHSQGLGQACVPNMAPKNCYDGTYIMFPGEQCYCILKCANGEAIGDSCSNDGTWTCQHIQATNPNANHMMACVPKVWNLCTQ